MSGVWGQFYYNFLLLSCLTTAQLLTHSLSHTHIQPHVQQWILLLQSPYIKINFFCKSTKSDLSDNV